MRVAHVRERSQVAWLPVLLQVEALPHVGAVLHVVPPMQEVPTTHVLETPSHDAPLLHVYCPPQVAPLLQVNVQVFVPLHVAAASHVWYGATVGTQFELALHVLVAYIVSRAIADADPTAARWAPPGMAGADSISSTAASNAS